MKPKLNVWRLATETHLTNGSTARVLTLRDQDGVIRRIARTPLEEEELRVWWKQYERRTRTQDLPVSKTLRKRLHTAIEELKKQGFKYSVKFGGVRLNPESGEREYCRWEVFKPTPWKIDEVFHMSRLFHDRYVKENVGVYVVIRKDGHDQLLRYRLESRKRKAVSL